MVVLGRLAWVLAKISEGHRVLVTSSYNSELKKQKLKVIIHPLANEVMFSELVQCCAWAAVNSLLCVAKSLEKEGIFHIVDRGHRHSSGVSEICFWTEIREEKVNKTANVADDTPETIVMKEVDAHSGVTEVDAHIDVEGDLRSSGVSFEGGAAEIDEEGIWVEPAAAGLLGPANYEHTFIGSIDSNCSNTDNGQEVGDRSTDVQEEGGSQHKKPRLLVEM